MAKCIKKVWTELQGFKIRASPGLNSFLPNKPLILLKRLAASIASSAKIMFLVLLIIFIYCGDTFTLPAGRQGLGPKTSLPAGWQGLQGGLEDVFGQGDASGSYLIDK